MNFLFLGDSITDCGHCFTRDNLGTGYVKMLSRLPGVTATNGGTDGFTFPDMLRKWRLMYAQNTYDCVVITCGINDVGVIADLEESGRPGDASAFLENSVAALQTFLEEQTGIASSHSEHGRGGISIPPDGFFHISRILLLEPFLFPVPKAREHWLPILVEMRTQIQQTIVHFNDKYSPQRVQCLNEMSAWRPDPASSEKPGPDCSGCTPCIRYIQTQPALDALASRFGYPAVTTDGIHLTGKGHECLAQLVANASGYQRITKDLQNPCGK